MTEGGWDVFVSYGHEDAAWVRVLAGNLHRAGFDVFLDEWELVGGDRFAGRLEEAIRSSVNGVVRPGEFGGRYICELLVGLPVSSA